MSPSLNKVAHHHHHQYCKWKRRGMNSPKENKTENVKNIMEWE